MPQIAASIHYETFHKMLLIKRLNIDKRIGGDVSAGIGLKSTIYMGSIQYFSIF
jgi:hypothetical protein